MARFIDMTGWKMWEHGVPNSRWTVIRQAERKNGKIQWLCECSCAEHNQKILCTNYLKDTHGKGSLSCGCLQKEKVKLRTIDMTGWKMWEHGVVNSYLEVISREPNDQYQRSRWKCKCKCGKETVVLGEYLRTGHILSCGCRRQEQSSLLHLDDLTGKVFGKLTVLNRDKSKPQGNGLPVYWICQCNCDNKTIKSISAGALRKGETISCGCINYSKGEQKIKEFLQEANIEYQAQKTFNSCRYLDTNTLARYDFYLPDYNTLIEYDGNIHFYATGGWFDDEGLQKIKDKDKYKNQWCIENDIILIRIPYTHYDMLNIEDLLPKTSKFIIRGNNDSTDKS